MTQFDFAFIRGDFPVTALQADFLGDEMSPKFIGLVSTDRFDGVLEEKDYQCLHILFALKANVWTSLLN